LRQEAFDVVEVLAPRLRSVPELRIDRFFGYVDELRGQPLTDIGSPSGEVCFTSFDQEEEICARADLDEMHYSVAGRACLASRVVSFRGVLERLPMLNRIKDPTDFQIIEFDDGIPSGRSKRRRHDRPPPAHPSASPKRRPLYLSDRDLQ
jgi:hypothetical protein